MKKDPSGHRPFGISWAALVAIGLGLLVSAGLSAQVAGSPGPVPAGSAPSSALEAVRAAWLIPKEEAEALLASAPLSAADFAVAAMIRHQEGLSLAAVAESKKRLGTWTAVVSQAEGPLRHTVFKGNARYPLQSPPPPDGAAPSNCDERIVELAEVMTLERLTGRSPAVLVKELGGKPFDALLAQARPGTQSPPKGAPGGNNRRRGGAAGAHEGPPGVPRPQDRPGEVRGWVGG